MKEIIEGFLCGISLCILYLIFSAERERIRIFRLQRNNPENAWNILMGKDK